MKLVLKIIFLLTVLFIVSFSMSRGYGAEFSFREIKFPGAAYTLAHGLNDDGDVVGIYALGDFEPEKGFTLKANVYKEFSMPDSRLSLPFGINRKDWIVGTYLPDDCPCAQGAFIFDGKTWKHIDVVRADAINRQGQVVGYREGDFPFNQLAYVWQKGKITPVANQFDNPRFLGSAATGINDKGQIVGYWFFELDSPEACCVEIHGFLKKGKVTKDFDTPFAESTASFPLGINAAGAIVGIDSFDGGVFSWLYQGGQFSKIEVPGAATTIVLGINNKSQIVGYSYGGEAGFVGFVGTPQKAGLSAASAQAEVN